MRSSRISCNAFADELDKGVAIVPSSLTPSERSQRSRLAAHVLHSRYDSRELTQRARDKFEQRFLDEVDPDRVLPEAERKRRAEHARKAYFGASALKSAKARRKRAQR